MNLSCFEIAFSESPASAPSEYVIYRQLCLLSHDCLQVLTRCELFSTSTKNFEVNMVWFIVVGCILMMKAVRAPSKSDIHKDIAMICGTDPCSRFWNRTKAKHHYIQSIACAAPQTAATKICFFGQWLSVYCSVHQCGNAECLQRAEKRCSICKNIHYCSTQCQREHWKQHQIQCDPGTRIKEENFEKAVKLFTDAMRL